MSRQTTLAACELCGFSDGSVTKRWAWFKPPAETKPFVLTSGAKVTHLIVAIDRCDYNPDCRERVEASGRTWPLEDDTKSRKVVLTGEAAATYARVAAKPVGGGDEQLQEAR